MHRVARYLTRLVKCTCAQHSGPGSCSAHRVTASQLLSSDPHASDRHWHNTPGTYAFNTLQAMHSVCSRRSYRHFPPSLFLCRSAVSPRHSSSGGPNAKAPLLLPNAPHAACGINWASGPPQAQERHNTHNLAKMLPIRGNPAPTSRHGHCWSCLRWSTKMSTLQRTHALQYGTRYSTSTLHTVLFSEFKRCLWPQASIRRRASALGRGVGCKATCPGQSLPATHPKAGVRHTTSTAIASASLPQPCKYLALLQLSRIMKIHTPKTFAPYPCATQRPNLNHLPGQQVGRGRTAGSQRPERHPPVAGRARTASRSCALGPCRSCQACCALCAIHGTPTPP